MSIIDSVEEGLLYFLTIYIIIGVAQFLYYPVVKKYVESQVFPDKSYSVSLIVPVKGTSPTLANNFRSMCSQNYSNYEIIFVSENEDDPGVVEAQKVINEFKGKEGAPSLHHICAGPLPEDSKMIAKSHNMLAAIKEADGEVLLFTDSDVTHPVNWIQSMVNPLGETIRGKKISASTAVFFLDPKGFLGIFSSLSTNAAVFLSSFSRRRLDLPVYASGASMAVFAEVFRKAGVEKEWRRNLNDDLVLASTLVDKGYTIFNLRRLPTRPVEKFDSLKGMNRKMVRWMLTVSHYTHPSFHRKVIFHGALNLQFQTMVNLGLIFAIFQGLGLLNLDWMFYTKLVGAAYVYNIMTRIVIARIIREKNVYPYLWLAPISQYFWGWYFLISSLFLKKFNWGGRVYTLDKRFGRLQKGSP